jgi:hypothetical protein
MPKERTVVTHNYYLRHRKEILKGNCERNKKMIRKRRQEVFELLGNKCANPFNLPHPDWCNDWRCLQIDHVNGGGVRELRGHKNRYSFYGMVIREIKAGSKEYQLLCANCNWIKRYENKECDKVS